MKKRTPAHPLGKNQKRLIKLLALNGTCYVLGKGAALKAYQGLEKRGLVTVRAYEGFQLDPTVCIELTAAGRIANDTL